VADQLWFMTCIWEEEDCYVVNIAGVVNTVAGGPRPPYRK